MSPVPSSETCRAPVDGGDAPRNEVPAPGSNPSLPALPQISPPAANSPFPSGQALTPDRGVVDGAAAGSANRSPEARGNTSNDSAASNDNAGNADDSNVDDGLHGNTSLARMVGVLGGTKICPVCNMERTNMLRHMAIHVTRCNIGGCTRSFDRACHLGDHLIEDHNEGQIQHCRLGCTTLSNTRRSEASLHLRQHVVANAWLGL